jgi:signal peptidase II
MLPLLVAFIVAAADQLTKQVVRWSFALNESRPVWGGFFSLTYVRNTGAAWGILSGQNVGLMILSVVVLLVLIRFRHAFLSRTWEHRLALGLLIGGVVGNLLDRARLGWVTDFLDFHWRGHQFPMFNIADSAICVGVFLYILSSLWDSGHPLHESRRKGGPAPADGPGQSPAPSGASPADTPDGPV